MYEHLMSLKQHCLAQPDVLIGGVGTRIYTRNHHQQQQQEAGGVWQEDTNWTRYLDEDWSLAGAESIVKTAIEKLGEQK